MNSGSPHPEPAHPAAGHARPARLRGRLRFEQLLSGPAVTLVQSPAAPVGLATRRPVEANTSICNVVVPARGQLTSRRVAPDDSPGVVLPVPWEDAP